MPEGTSPLRGDLRGRPTDGDDRSVDLELIDTIIERMEPAKEMHSKGSHYRAALIFLHHARDRLATYEKARKGP